VELEFNSLRVETPCRAFFVFEFELILEDLKYALSYLLRERSPSCLEDRTLRWRRRRFTGAVPRDAAGAVGAEGAEVTADAPAHAPLGGSDPGRERIPTGWVFMGWIALID